MSKQKTKIGKQNPTSQKGITLIALIITIIVMLILVGVSVTVALDGGLFSTAKNATGKTQLELEKEQLLELAMGAIGDNGKVDTEKLDAAVLADGKFTKTDDRTYKSEKSGNTFTFYVNDRELCKYDSTLSGTKVGLICESGKASFGYFGASDEVGGSSNCEYYKPVGASSGRINANLCTEDITAFIGRDNDGSSFVSANTDNSFNYRVYAEEDGLYSFGVKYRATENTELDIYVNGVLARSLTLGTTDAKYMTEVSLGKLMLSKGRNVITVYVRSGNADIKSYEILRTESAEMTLDFNNGSIDEHLVHSDGVSWENASGKLQCRAIGKRTFGSTLWSDYAYRCKIIFAQNIDMGLLFRTKNAAESGLFASGRGFFTEPSINGSTKGADWMQGYYLHFTNNKVALEKCNFSNTELVSTRITTDGTTSVNVTVVCTGPNIKVYLDELLVIDYTDPDPFLTGAVGVRLSSGVGAFDNIKVIPYKEQ